MCGFNLVGGLSCTVVSAAFVWLVCWRCVLGLTCIGCGRELAVCARLWKWKDFYLAHSSLQRSLWCRGGIMSFYPTLVWWIEESSSAWFFYFLRQVVVLWTQGLLFGLVGWSILGRPLSSLLEAHRTIALVIFVFGLVSSVTQSKLLFLQWVAWSFADRNHLYWRPVAASYLTFAAVSET